MAAKSNESDAMRKPARAAITAESRPPDPEATPVIKARLKKRVTIEAVLKDFKLGVLVLWLKDKWGWRVPIATAVGIAIGCVIGIILANKYLSYILRNGEKAENRVQRDPLPPIIWEDVPSDKLRQSLPAVAAQKREMETETLRFTNVTRLVGALHFRFTKPTDAGFVVLCARGDKKLTDATLYLNRRFGDLFGLIKLSKVDQGTSYRFAVPPVESDDSLIAILLVSGSSDMKETKVLDLVETKNEKPVIGGIKP